MHIILRWFCETGVEHIKSFPGEAFSPCLIDSLKGPDGPSHLSTYTLTQEAMALYAGLLLAPAEGFGQGMV